MTTIIRIMIMMIGNGNDNDFEHNTNNIGAFDLAAAAASRELQARSDCPILFAANALL